MAWGRIQGYEEERCEIQECAGFSCAKLDTDREATCANVTICANRAAGKAAFRVEIVCLESTGFACESSGCW